MIYHIPFPFPVTFPIDIFGSKEVISILDFILILILGISSIYGFFKGFLQQHTSNANKIGETDKNKARQQQHNRLQQQQRHNVGGQRSLTAAVNTVVNDRSHIGSSPITYKGFLKVF